MWLQEGGGGLEEIEKEIRVGLWARMGEARGREGEARNCKIIYVSKSNVEGSWCVWFIVSRFSNLQDQCNDLA